MIEGGGQVADLTRDFVFRYLERFQQSIRRRAEDEGLRVRDYACTFLAAVVGENSGAFVQVGDGAIITSPPDEPDEYCWVFWPQKGEYENTTNFVTDPLAAERLEYEFGERRYDEIAVLTDGLQRIALHFQSQTAYGPFFRPLFEFLRTAAAEDSDQLTAALSAFLDSASVNERVDDDKTLVLATRRLPVELEKTEWNHGDREISDAGL